MFLHALYISRRPLLLTGLLWASISVAFSADPVARSADDAAATKAQAAQSYGKLPLSFEANQGQADKALQFLSRGSGYSLFLADSSALLALKGGSGRPAASTNIVRMDLVGAKHALDVTGLDQLPGTANYFLGNDPAQWHSGVPTYAKVKYTGVYPGIDLIYYGNQRQLEYDFVVAPGANPKRIRLQFAGAKRLNLGADGDLTASTTNGQIVFHKPVVYQVNAGERHPIDGQFAMLSKNAVGFALGRYDHAKPLVIDPVLSYSTYLGGSFGDWANAIAVDSSGNAYVTGGTFSTNFPGTTDGYQPTNNGAGTATNAFVTKLNPTGTGLVYSTYLGGSASESSCNGIGDQGYGIAVDGSGNAYVTGTTCSANFPVSQSAFQTAYNSKKKFGESAFVTKLNATGTGLVYSTYLGGSADDGASGIAVDGFDNAYVTGSATSTNFPVTSPTFQSTNNADTTDGWGSAFVTKLNATGTALVYSTYLGGTLYGADGNAIAVDSSGDAYVSGNAKSADFPVTEAAFQTVNKAVENEGPTTVNSNAYVTKFNPTGTALVYSTFLGGSINDLGLGIAVDSSGDAYVTGYTMSSDFPVTGSAFQPANNGYNNEAANAFVTQVNPTGEGLVYSSYLGGTGIPPQSDNASGSGDAGYGIAVDGLGNAYVTGLATSTNFPVTSGAYQIVNNAAGDLQKNGVIGVNAFVTKINPGGTALLYSTYLGGSSQDYGLGIALDGVGVYVAGAATSTDFPTTGAAYQPKNGGDEDAFAAQFAISSADLYNGSDLTLPSVVIGSATYSDMVLTATTANIVSGPTGAAPKSSGNIYYPATKQLSIPAVTVGSNTYYNVVIAAPGLVSVGQVIGADRFDGTYLHIASVQVGGTIYHNVVVTVDIKTVSAPLPIGMPALALDQYAVETGVLQIPAVEYAGKVYTNVTITVNTVVSINGIPIG